MTTIDNEQKIDEFATRRSHALKNIVNDLLSRVEAGKKIERGDVRYFNFVLVKDLPDPEAEIDRAIRIVTVAQRTNTLDDLRAIIRE